MTVLRSPAAPRSRRSASTSSTRASGPFSPALRVASARFWHFVEVDRRARRRRGGDARAPADLRPAGTRGRRPDGAGHAAARHHLAVVVEGHRHRDGSAASTRSAASSAARSISLDGDRRPRRDPAAAARSDDRDRARRRSDEADELFHHFPPKPLTEVDVLGRGRAAIDEANRGVRPRAGARRDRLPRRVLHGHRRNPDRRRADDVRAGELGALPPQDLQRVVGHRRRAAGRSRSSA